MRIAIDARFYGLEHAGLGRYTKNLVHELAVVDNVNQYTLFVTTEYADLALGDNFATVVVNAPHHSLTEQILLPLKIGFNKYDLVHFPHYVVPVFNFTTPFIVTVHDLIKNKFKGRETTTLPYYKYLIKDVVYKFDFTWAVKKSLAIITPTEYVKTDIINNYHVSPEKVYAFGEGVDVSLAESNLFGSNIQLKKPYLLYVGKTYVHKNVKLLIESLKDLPPEYSLVIVGEKKIFWERVVKSIDDQGLLNRVHHLGFVKDLDLTSIYQNAVAFVSASLEEGFGLPPLEAMAIGCPVILSNIPVHKEVCGEAALYFALDQPNGLVKQVLKIASDSSLRRSQIVKGYEQVKKHSWRKMAEETLKLYQKVLA